MPPRAIDGRGRGNRGHRCVQRLKNVGQQHHGDPTPSLPLEGMDEQELPEGSESIDDTASQRDHSRVDLPLQPNPLPSVA